MYGTHTEKDQLAALVAKVMDPTKGRTAKDIHDSFMKLLDSKLIESPSNFYGYVDSARPDEEWWNILKS